jgi:SAM-dependent methyltransferase
MLVEMNGFRTWATAAFDTAMDANLRNIEAALRRVGAGGHLLDLGCDDGARTLRFARAARSARVSGVEIVHEQAERAGRVGIEVEVSDLGEPLPFERGTFDTVVANQVIEHLHDTDLFVSEIHRVLRPRGVAVVSTENLASWHNVASLLLGWQPFSLTNVSGTRGGLGNPLAVHRGERPGLRSWQHVRVFSYRGLKELFGAHGFRELTTAGAGYFPLPSWLAKLDARHAAFLTITAVA